MKKKNILLVNEFSGLNTGYSIYGREILTRLYNTGKYNIAELALYVSKNDNRLLDYPWKIYVNTPFSQEEDQIYNGDQINQYGKWRFNEVLLDHQVDVCFLTKDPWMDIFTTQSPYRHLFNLGLMAPCDSAPQHPLWIDAYASADAVFTYSDFGKETLEKESGGKIKVRGIPSPAFDAAFKPYPDKKQVRQELNLPIPTDSLIVGTIMRNQKRKLFDDLFVAFRQFLDQNPDLAPKTYLYCHTSIIDLGWDLPRLLREAGISHKVLFTYVCNTCKNITPSFFADAKRFCQHCGKMDASGASVQVGVNNEQLAKVYNCFDVFIQYAICLGKEEEILTRGGWKQIQNVNIGDEVFTHKHR